MVYNGRTGLVLITVLLYLSYCEAATNCNELLTAANGQLSDGAYSVTNSDGQSFDVYCQFYNGYGYAFLSRNNAVDIDISALTDDTSAVEIRHKRTDGKQYTATLEQLSKYADVPIHLEYNGYTGYEKPENYQMTPYVYVGFVPQARGSRGNTEGWKCNGKEYTFTNCDGHISSYIAFMFNQNNVAYTSYTGSYNELMFPWYDDATAVTSAENLPDEYFASIYEVHHGGCGGYGEARAKSVITGANVGFKFTITCAAPSQINLGSVSHTGVSVGSTATYSCSSGYTILSGDATRTCTSSGAWSGTEPVCGVVTCAAPSQLNHGSVSHTGDSVGSTATYSCSSGYTLLGGGATRTCNAAGEWSGTEPVCGVRNCNELLNAANGLLSDGEYNLTNSDGQSFEVYCQFYNGYGYAFLSTNNAVDIDMSTLTDDTSAVEIRHKRTDGKQYKATLEQLSKYADVPIHLEYNGYTGYEKPENYQMTPYVYVGFVPQARGSKGNTEGWKCNGEEYTFTNCDGHISSYIAFMFNQNNVAYTSYTGSYNELMFPWYDDATAVTSADNLPDEYFASIYEVHHGGCGGFGEARAKSVITGATVGVKFTITCAAPSQINLGSVSHTGVSVGSTATYSCSSGHSILSGDATRTCSGSGAWSGAEPVCGVVTCAAPSQINQGSVSHTGDSEGSTATYSCSNGYTLLGGAATRTCTVPGVWSGTEPVCGVRNCNELLNAANGQLSDGEYDLTNSDGQSFEVYCQFYNGYGYAFLSTNTAVDVDMSALTDETSAVEIRHKRTDGKQYTATLEQLSKYSNVPIHLEYNGYTGYEKPENYQMTPYIYVGFVPKARGSKGNTEGWKCNGEEYTFTNCDGHISSYIAFMFNQNNVAYTSYTGSYNELMFPWYDDATAVTSAENLPDEYFASIYEVHHGGCGGFGEARAKPVITGATIGVKFTITCAAPSQINLGSVSHTGVSVGSTATYSCSRGHSILSGDATRTCTGLGAWSGTEPVCGVVTCAAPSQINEGSVSQTGDSEGSTATYSCSSGYSVIIGDTTRTCSAPGVWSGTEPVCGVRNINELLDAANGQLSDGEYTLTNTNGESFQVYCQFYNGYGYAFLSTNTNVDVDMSTLTDDTSAVEIRHKRTDGKQYTATLEQLSKYSNVPIHIQYNGYTGYEKPENYQMTPYVYVGFVPKARGSKGNTEGWKCNGKEYTFTNCDGPISSYIAFMFNQNNVAYTSYTGSYNELMFPWYDDATAVTSADNLPDEYFASIYEVHHGGCGGFGEARAKPVITGATIGVKFTTVVECAAPSQISDGSVSYTDITEGNNATYSCSSGYAATSGDTTRTCTDTGEWSGSELVCDAITCAAPGQISQGVLSNTDVSYGNTVTYSCSSGLSVISGDASRTCSGSGEWSGTEPVCGVHGNWADWSSWSICSVTCDNGTWSRARTCTNPAPVNGDDCTGSDSATETCIMSGCPVDGQWSSWNAYEACSVTCLGGVKIRSRDCGNPNPSWGGADCPGDSTETDTCNHNSCDVQPPIDGNWGTWAQWNGCSVTCGTGIRRRYRACDSPAPARMGEPCQGEQYAEESCSGAQSCPVSVDGNWGAWSTVSPCDVTCGSGTMVKARQCDSPAPSNGGRDCTGDAVVVSVCTLQACTSAGTGSAYTGYGDNYVNVCPNGYFTCFSGGITCLSDVYRCDCESDCDDGSDETIEWAGCDVMCAGVPGLRFGWLGCMLFIVFHVMKSILVE